jgi:hypothetical protein
VIATKGGLLRDRTRPVPPRRTARASPCRLRGPPVASPIGAHPDHSTGPTPRSRSPSRSGHSSTSATKERSSTGICTVSEAQLDEALRHAPMVSVQNRYRRVDRRSGPPVVRGERDRRAFVPWAPLEAGRTGDDAVIDEIARAHHATPHQVAIAWLLTRSPVIVPIPGTGSPAHREENMGAATLKLSPDQVAALGADAGGT